MMHTSLKMALAALFLATPLSAQEKPHAFVGAKIFTIEGEPIADGTLVVQNGKILAVGSADEVVLPADAEVIDAAGKVIMPGLICSHSHIGGAGGADGSNPIQPDVRVYDSVNVLDSGFKRALAGGLTTINIMPGSGHLMSGQTVYVKIRGGATVEDIAYRDDNGKLLGGMKMANGTNSMRDPPFPGTRGKSAALVRQKYVKAQEYRDKIERAAGDPEKMPPRDIGLEAMVEVLEGKRTVHHHTHRNDDIVTVLRLAKEFGFRVVLHHVSEAWKVVPQIAEAKVAASIMLIDSPGGKLEALDLNFKNPAVLEEAGVEVGFHTDDSITDSRLFLRMAALGVRAGMSRAGALRAVTLAGARMLDLDDRIGSLKAGKDADFILLSGDPLSTYTKVLETWVEGEKVFDRDDPGDHLYAVGGYGASDEQEPHNCCFQGEVQR